jgi:1-acyl-sn-glycerol-3-phosphate acyltransferase
MMRLAWRLLALLLLLLAGLIILIAFFPLMPRPWRDSVKGAWSRVLVMICGLRVHVVNPHYLRDSVGLQARSLTVLNHVSWLDIFVLNTVWPSTFVAKSEIRRWPVVGWLVAGAGTVFVERGKRHAVRDVNHAIARRIDQGEQVAFFPEGTTSSGDCLLPFHTSLFSAAIHDNDTAQMIMPVQPGVLQYFQHGQPSKICAYVGDMSLVASVLQILSAKGLSVTLEFLQPITQLPAPVTRHAIAAHAEQAMQQALTANRSAGF